MALGHWLKDYIGPKGIAEASQGGGGTSQPLIIRANANTLDHTWNEIANNPTMMWFETTEETWTVRVPIVAVRFDEEASMYVVAIDNDGVASVYGAEDANGYPSLR